MKIVPTLFTVTTLLYVLSSPVMGMDKKHEEDKPKTTSITLHQSGPDNGVPVQSPATTTQLAPENPGQKGVQSLSLQTAQGDSDKTGGSAPLWDKGRLFSEVPDFLIEAMGDTFYVNNIRRVVTLFEDQMRMAMKTVIHDMTKPMNTRMDAWVHLARYFFHKGQIEDMREVHFFNYEEQELSKKADSYLEILLYRASSLYETVRSSPNWSGEGDYYYVSFDSITKAKRYDPNVYDLARFYMAEIRINRQIGKDLKTHEGHPVVVIDNDTAYKILEETRLKKGLPSWVYLRIDKLMQKNKAGKPEEKVEKKANGQGTAVS